jgi:RNA recognition motif-containing protein
MNIYVGNLSMDVTKTDLQQAFEAFGKVASATVIRDKFSGESRGFGFVEMPDQSEGQAALAGLNGSELMGKNIVVSEARPRQEGRGGGGGGRGSGGGGGYRGGNRGGGGRRF